MNWDLLFKAFQVLVVLTSAGLNVYLYLRSKEDQRLAAIEGRQAEIEDAAEADREAMRLSVTERRAHVSDLHQRVALLEERIKQVPTHADLRRIYEKLAELVSRVERQDERSEIVLGGLRRIEQHLMER